MAGQRQRRYYPLSNPGKIEVRPTACKVITNEATGWVDQQWRQRPCNCALVTLSLEPKKTSFTTTAADCRSECFSQWVAIQWRQIYTVLKPQISGPHDPEPTLEPTWRSKAGADGGGNRCHPTNMVTHCDVALTTSKHFAFHGTISMHRLGRWQAQTSVVEGFRGFQGAEEHTATDADPENSRLPPLPQLTPRLSVSPNIPHGDPQTEINRSSKHSDR